MVRFRLRTLPDVAKSPATLAVLTSLLLAGCASTMSTGPAPEAVAWVRRHYHPSAVETPAQEQLIGRFARAVKGP